MGVFVCLCKYELAYLLACVAYLHVCVCVIVLLCKLYVYLNVIISISYTDTIVLPAFISV